MRENVKEKLVIVIASIGMFLSTLDTGIINVALPFLKNHFQTNTNTAALTVIGYSTSLAIFIMLFGILSDIKGKLKIANFGMWVFMLASLFCGISQSIGSIIAFRIIQGIGAAALQATSASLVTTLVRPENQNSAIGTVGIMIGLGPVLGPSLGGFLLALGSWRLIFFINIPFTLIGIICALLIKNKVTEQKYDKKVDIAGFVLNAIMISCLLIGLNELEKQNMRILGAILLVIAVISAVALYFVEKNKDNATVDMHIVTSKKTFTLLLQTMLFGFASAIVFLLPPFLFENVMHISAGLTGLLVLGAPLGIAIFSKVAGNINDGTRNTSFSFYGMSGMLIAFVILTLLPQKAPALVTTIALFIYGVGGGFFQPSNVSALMKSVGLSEQGSMSALQRMTQNVAIAIGSSVGSIIMFEFKKQIFTGIKAGYLMTSIIIFVVLLFSFIMRKNLNEKQKI
ncbi:MFS transporter [Ligilactobacillus aviarius]|uniref:MFS transporter n=1 Tax=Ligilactobacillus aviarius TaxID=1606 RepID=UPI00195BE44B|nr:MFS transporter [Ligilactobacillus aviarius]MBM6863172.1 MFS transporter [Ligilactobacillus aviarius]